MAENKTLTRAQIEQRIDDLQSTAYNLYMTDCIEEYKDTMRRIALYQEHYKNLRNGR